MIMGENYHRSLKVIFFYSKREVSPGNDSC